MFTAVLAVLLRHETSDVLAHRLLETSNQVQIECFVDDAYATSSFSSQPLPQSTKQLVKLLRSSTCVSCKYGDVKSASSKQTYDRMWYLRCDCGLLSQNASRGSQISFIATSWTLRSGFTSLALPQTTSTNSSFTSRSHTVASIQVLQVPE